MKEERARLVVGVVVIDDKKSRKSRVLDEVESEVMVFNPSGNAWLWYTRIEGE